jgi:hypothetical protein
MGRAVKRLLCAAMFAAVLALACDRTPREGDNGAPPVDTELMAFLSEARALHHQANLKENANDVAGAIGAMDRLVVARRPHPERPAPEVEEVLADAYARLAELQLKKGDHDAAAGAIARGLEHAPGTTYFRGHLFEVHGLVESGRSAQLADAGKPVEAARATDRAMQLLEDAIKIQDQVIQRSLPEAGR